MIRAGRVVAARVRSVWDRTRRLTLLPLLIRVAVVVTALSAFAIAYPTAALTGEALASLAVVALLPGIWPRRFWPTLAALVAVGGWLYTTLGQGQPVTLWRLLALTALLYLGHALCALAALLPYDAVVDPAVVLRWLARTAGVLLASSLVGVLLLSSATVGGGRGILVATVGGLVVAVLVTVVLGWLTRRP